jgi:sulfite reductase (NADPH) hemoprotein beta-component
VVREFLPWDQLLNYIEAMVRVYNGYGRRDNKWKARIKILVKSEGQAFIDAVEKEYQAIVEQDGAPHTITQAELDRVTSHFVVPELKPANLPSSVNPQGQLYQRWLAAKRARPPLPGMKTVTLSFKRVGFAPGDADADTMDALAQLAEQFSAAEARLTHEQNLLLPWVFESDLPALYEAARKLGPGAAQHRPADRHDRLPRRRLLLAGQRPLAAHCRGRDRALPGPGRAV